MGGNLGRGTRSAIYVQVPNIVPYIAMNFNILLCNTMYCKTFPYIPKYVKVQLLDSNILCHKHSFELFLLINFIAGGTRGCPTTMSALLLSKLSLPLTLDSPG